MKQILIINLRRFGDIIGTTHLIDSIATANPDAKIDLLVFKEFSIAAQNIANIDTIHSIDRIQILQLDSCDYSSEGVALELFLQSIVSIQKSTWDSVVNYSNDRISTYLTTCFSQSENDCIGLKFSTPQKILYSNRWSILLNDILPSMNYTPVHLVDCYCGMMKIPYASSANSFTPEQAGVPERELYISHLDFVRSSFQLVKDWNWSSPVTGSIFLSYIFQYRLTH